MAVDPTTIQDALDEINDSYYRRNLTDGLPIIPPTPGRVEAMLKSVDRDPQEVLGLVAPKWAPASVQKLAINAVMAGCLPAYFPVVLAAMECILDEAFNLYGVQATTNPVGPAFVVNGPIRRELEMNCGYNVFGEGNRANATIGRAVRLALRNIGGGIPGELDRATTGWPGKYTLVFGENEEQSPWDPYSVDRGHLKGANVITAFGVGGFSNVGDLHSTTGLGVLGSFCRLLATGGGAPSSGVPVIAVCPEHAGTLQEDGFGKAEVKKYLFENARVKASGFPEAIGEEWVRVRNNQIKASGSNAPEVTMDSWGQLARSADDIQIIVAGGAGCHSALLSPTFGGAVITREIRG